MPIATGIHPSQSGRVAADAVDAAALRPGRSALHWRQRESHARSPPLIDRHSTTNELRPVLFRRKSQAAILTTPTCKWYEKKSLRKEVLPAPRTNALAEFLCGPGKRKQHGRHRQECRKEHDRHNGEQNDAVIRDDRVERNNNRHQYQRRRRVTEHCATAQRADMSQPRRNVLTAIVQTSTA